MGRLNIIIRYLFTFLLFAGLLLALFVPVYRYVTDFTLNNELSHIANRLDQGLASLDSVFSALDLLTFTHRQDPRFQDIKSYFRNPPDRRTLDLNFTALLALRDSISRALLPFSIDVDAGLLFSDGTAITNRGIYCYPYIIRFYGPVLQCGDLSLEEWRGLLAPAGSIIPAMPYTSAYYPERDAVTFSNLWAYSNYSHDIIFFAVLPVDGIVSLLVDADLAAAAYVRMLNAQGEPLFSRGNDANGNFHVISRRNTINSMLFEIGVPDSYIAGKLRPVRNLILLFACVTGALVIVISFLFAWRSSLPLISSIRTIETQTALIRAQTIDRIKGALLSGDEAAARIILRDCYLSLHIPIDPMIVGLITDMLYAMLNELRGEIIPALALPEYESGSHEEIFETLYPDCFSRICEAVRSRKEEGISAQGREVLAYINEHLYESGLYITMAADHFNISGKTLQKLVKEYTGLTFQNYVEKHRMDKSFELLSSSADSVSQIALACGFSNVNTFYHSFKRLYGYPPGRLQRGSWQ